VKPIRVGPLLWRDAAESEMTRMTRMTRLLPLVCLGEPIGCRSRVHTERRSESIRVDPSRSESIAAPLLPTPGPSGCCIITQIRSAVSPSDRPGPPARPIGPAHWTGPPAVSRPRPPLGGGARARTASDASRKPSRAMTRMLTRILTRMLTLPPNHSRVEPVPDSDFESARCKLEGSSSHPFPPVHPFDAWAP
jgi:hypothetical protein